MASNSGVEISASRKSRTVQFRTEQCSGIACCPSVTFAICWERRFYLVFAQSIEAHLLKKETALRGWKQIKGLISSRSATAGLPQTAARRKLTRNRLCPGCDVHTRALGIAACTIRPPARSMKRSLCCDPCICEKTRLSRKKRLSLPAALRSSQPVRHKLHSMSHAC